MNQFNQTFREFKSNLRPSALRPCLKIWSRRKQAHSLNRRMWSLFGTFPSFIAIIILECFVQMSWVESAETPLSDEELIEVSPVKTPPGQIGRYADQVDPASIKWGRFAIHNPEVAKRLRDGRKTDKQKAEEELSLLAITDPAAYRTALDNSEKVNESKTQEEIAQARRLEKEREESEKAMLDPIKSAREFEKKKTPKQRRKEAVAAFAILSPHEFNRRLEPYKSADLKQTEADAILSLTQPRVFWEQRLREKKTGSRQPNKDSKIEAEESPRPVPPGQSNKPETGATQGGAR